MGHKNKLSLVKQANDRLVEMLSDGISKHECKRNSVDTSQMIFSYSTLKSYLKHCCMFLKYCKENHRCKTLEDCRQYADEWLQTRFHLSAYTVKLESAALAKLYGCTTKDFIQTPPRMRKDIKRSRGFAVRDLHFNEDRHRDFVEFCKSTGLRRRELEQLRGDCLVWEDGKPYINVCRGGKGGKQRMAPVIGDAENVIRIMKAAGDGRVFQKVSKCADIHSYRSEYATRIYLMNARPLDVCKADPFYNPEHFNGKGKPKGGLDTDSVYTFRKDRAGEWLDKRAMMAASQALGHNRISVVAEHYIRF